MRRGAIATLVAVVMAAGCGAPEPDDGRPVVLATFTVIADIASNVAGDRLRVESITRPGSEIHGYEPTPGDVARASEADLVLDNGLGLEAWFAQFVEDADVPHVVVSAGIDPIPIAGDAYDGLANPHAWMSPLVVVGYVEEMVTAFSDLDPDGAAEYRENADAYIGELEQVHTDLVAALEPVPQEQRVLVTCEGAFSYLARDTGLEEGYIWPVNAEQQATPQQVAGAIELVLERSVPAVFCESTVSDAPMQQVVEATGAAFGGVLYVDSLSEPDGPVPTYLDLIRHDAEVIATALTAGAP